MPNYEIALYTTCDADNIIDSGVISTVQTYIENFVDDGTDSATVNISDYHPQVPTEDPYVSFTHADMVYARKSDFSCSEIPGHTQTYSSLGNFIYLFADRFQNEEPYSKDGVILLSAGSGGKTWAAWSDNREPYGGACAGISESINDLPDSPVKYEDELSGTEREGHQEMQTILHELGHLLLMQTSISHHEVGDTEFDSDVVRHRSPMGIDGKSINECGRSYANGGSHPYHLTYSYCSHKNWKEPSDTW